MPTGSVDYYKPNVVFTSMLTKLQGSIDGLAAIVSALGETLTIDTPATGNLLNKLDALDGTMDGKLTLAELNGPTCDLLAYILGVKTSVETGGDLITKLDNLDGKADGKMDLTSLTAHTVTAIARLLDIKASVETGGDLLNKLDNLDGVADGVLDLTKLQTMDIFYDSVAEKPRLQLAVENLDGTIGTLITKLNELVGIHDDTAAMVAYSQQDWNGTATAGSWALISSEHQTRNLLQVNNTGGQYVDYSRDGGATTAGQIPGSSSATFYDAPGVWLKPPTGSRTWTAHEEWAT